MALNIPNPFKNTPKLDWQKLKSRNKNVPDCYRSPVFGGWLISNGYEGGITFIPDPEHKWDGESYPILD
ncbi:hypothetical protein [Suttonella ornithocola]|uniref:Uncharacterized protein n=1 Tax=Suttonella ornithocola TaxID=279832 RepID=A0A380MTM9_9GAMM|nr:hypothetical protein [Suttonella ornithocola]SUO95628.1 Uncharacterised protein [Suttonella ornithocola]